MDFSIKVDPSTWQRYISTPKKGEGVLTDSFLNKGTAFTAREREELDVLGLLPPAIFTIEEQLGADAAREVHLPREPPRPERGPLLPAPPRTDRGDAPRRLYAGRR
jgi:hypothetical protein